LPPSEVDPSILKRSAGGMLRPVRNSSLLPVSKEPCAEFSGSIRILTIRPRRSTGRPQH
jgi:hypothetical protein